MDIVFAFSDVGSADLFPFERNLLTILVFFICVTAFIRIIYIVWALYKKASGK